MYTIGIVEDDRKIREELSVFLYKHGYESILFVDFSNVVEDILKSKLDLLLLDLNLPIVDGHYICRELRKQSNLPIIIVTSRDSELDELMSINLEADDFIGKPYNLQILLARVERLLTRSYAKKEMTTIEINKTILNLPKNTLTYNHEEIELTKNEFRILYVFYTHINEIVSRDELMNDMWESNLFVDDNTLTVNINRLRKKLEQIGLQDYIHTKRGLGYSIYEN